jgi:hypothetical protein
MGLIAAEIKWSINILRLAEPNKQGIVDRYRDPPESAAVTGYGHIR